MVWFICLATLAAFGFLSVVWCLLGWLLPSVGEVLVCREGSDTHAAVRRYLWLRGLGLIRCPLIVTARELSLMEQAWFEECGVEVCPPEELARRLGIGEKDIVGTGNGDPPGGYQRRGVSEL